MSRLKLKCDEPFSNFAFNVNLRRYTEADAAAAGAAEAVASARHTELSTRCSAAASDVQETKAGGRIVNNFSAGV